MDKEEYLNKLRNRDCVLCEMGGLVSKGKNNNNHVVQSAVLRDRLGLWVDEKEFFKDGYERKRICKVFSEYTLCEEHNRMPLRNLEPNKFKENVYYNTVMKVISEVRLGDLMYKDSIRFPPRDEMENARNELSFDYRGRMEMENYFKMLFYNLVMFLYVKTLKFGTSEEHIYMIKIIETFLYENRCAYRNNSDWITKSKTESAEVGEDGIAGYSWGNKNGTPINAFPNSLKLRRDSGGEEEFYIKYQSEGIKVKEGKNRDEGIKTGFILEVKLPFNDEIVLEGDLIYTINTELEGIQGEICEYEPEKEVKYIVKRKEG